MPRKCSLGPDIAISIALNDSHCYSAHLDRSLTAGSLYYKFAICSFLTLGTAVAEPADLLLECLLDTSKKETLTKVQEMQFYSHSLLKLQTHVMTSPPFTQLA